MSQDVPQKIDEIINKAYMPERHTYFQLKNFVIGKEVTIQAQLWQVVRELRARKDTIENLVAQLEDADDMLELGEIKLDRISANIKRLTEQGDSEDAEFARREMVVQHRQAERSIRRVNASIDVMQKKLQYVLEESTYLIRAFESLSAVEEMKPLDDITAQKQYWNEKFHEELKLRLVLGRPLDSEFVRTVMALDDDSPVKQDVMAIVQKIQRQMQFSNEACNVEQIGA